jgi:flagellin
MIQTAEGALDQVQTMMTRMRNLAVQAASDTNGKDERTAINTEVQQLQSEIDNIALRTTFNGLGLLDGTLVKAPVTQSGGTVAGGLAIGTTGAVTAVDVSGAKESSAFTFAYDAGTKMLSVTDGTTTSTIDVSAFSVAAGGTNTLNFAASGVKLTVANSDVAALTGDTIGVALAAVVGTPTITTGAAAGKTVTLQTGADASTQNQTTVTMLDTRLSSAVAGSPLLALKTALISFNNAATSIPGATSADGRALITAVDVASNYISSQRAQLGATQNRLGYAAASLTATAQNVAAANSQIRDVDVAAETSAMSKSQILMQAGVSVLAQANQVSQLALKLLNG